MPDQNETIARYLTSIAPLNNEAARAQAFRTLLSDLFGDQPNFLRDLLGGIEHRVEIHGDALARRGHIDSLCGNIVIEVESTIDGSIPGPSATGHLGEAQDQLRGYVAGLWTLEPPGERRPYLAMATDGVRFALYTPTMNDGDAAVVTAGDVALEVLTLELIDLAELQARGVAYEWLDRYFLRQTMRHPTATEIIEDFGLQSHAFQVCYGDLRELWSAVASEDEYAVLYDSWDNYLRIAYGSSPDTEDGIDLFVRHTYLATLAKLLVWARYHQGEVTAIPHDSDLAEILAGQAFERLGIRNFLEEDLFSWIAREETLDRALFTSRRLYRSLANYTLTSLSEDVFKALYEQLVDPAGRHDLGEFYTPDWLAAQMVEHLLSGRAADARVIDPACGSGTFLYHVILHKKERLLSQHGEPSAPSLLASIEDQVVGIDVHPLAVTIAKANYLLALGDLLADRRASFSVPVYLANSIRRPPEETRMVRRYDDLVGRPLQPDLDEDIQIFFPSALLQDHRLADRLIDACRGYARQAVEHGSDLEGFRQYLLRQEAYASEDESLFGALFDMAEALRDFIERGRDTIQAYILKNMYKPVFLRGEFDVVIGNPPWLSYRYLRTPEYQDEIRGLMERYGLWGGANVATQMELATLFFARCSDWYLGENGAVGFVLPRSVYNGQQHHSFRCGNFRHTGMRFDEYWDLHAVRPLFRMPACVLYATKAPGAEITYPVPGRRFQGVLPRKNADVDEVADLQVEEVEYSLHATDVRSFIAAADEAATPFVTPSEYADSFSQGASLVPRALWIVESGTHSQLGSNNRAPIVRTYLGTVARAQAPWRDVRIDGNVESDLLYAALLSRDLIAFYALGIHTAALPALPAGDRFRLLDQAALREEGYAQMAARMADAETIWEEHRTAKSARHTLLEWLDYRGKLHKQNPGATHMVVYAAAGTHVTAATVEVPVDAPLIIDTTLYYGETASADEAHYLCGILNSPALGQALRVRQPRGEFNPRHVHKKVFDVGHIPPYDPLLPAHRELAALSARARQAAEAWCEARVQQEFDGDSVAAIESFRRAIEHTRITARAHLEPHYARMLPLVREVIGL